MLIYSQEFDIFKKMCFFTYYYILCTKRHEHDEESAFPCVVKIIDFSVVVSMVFHVHNTYFGVTSICVYYLVIQVVKTYPPSVGSAFRLRRVPTSVGCLYRLLTFHLPNLISLLHCLGRTV